MIYNEVSSPSAQWDNDHGPGNMTPTRKFSWIVLVVPVFDNYGKGQRMSIVAKQNRRLMPKDLTRTIK